MVGGRRSDDWRKQLSSVLDRQAGLFTSPQAVASGVSRDRLATMVRQGVLGRPLPSVYVSHTGPLSAAELGQACVLWAGSGAAVAGAWALVLAGMHVLALPHEITVVTPPGRRLHRRRLHAVPGGSAGDQLVKRWADGGSDPADLRIWVRHRVASDIDRDLVPATTPRIQPARAVLQAAAWQQDPRVAVGLLLATAQQGLCSAEAIAAALSRTADMRHHALLQRVVKDAIDGSQSLPEVELVRALKRRGLPAPTRQEVRCVGGRRRYADLYWKEWRLVVEIDGALHQRRAAQDARRDRQLLIGGDAVLRFGAWEVRLSAAAVAAEIEAALRSRGWRP